MHDDINKIADDPGLLLAIILSMWGGVASFARKIKMGAKPSMAEFIGELVISGFCGIMVLMLGNAYQMDIYLIGAAAGIAGHMGSRGIFMAERWIDGKVKKIINRADD
jgi:uncharacterized membrane protein